MNSYRYLATLLTMLTLTFSASAQFNYVTNNSGSITITGYTGSVSNVTIPDMINSLPVTSIGASAFDALDGDSILTSITIPDSVTSIENFAFYYCEGLTNAIIGNGVTSIGWSVFNSTGLTEITIPDNVISLGSETFFNCKSLTNATIGNSVTNIGPMTFGECSELTDITIPDSVISIGQWAFSGCSGLTSFTIPRNVNFLEKPVFAGSSNLVSLFVDTDNTSYSDLNGVLFNKDKTLLIACPEGKTGSYTIPNSVTSVDNGAFYLCSGLNSIIIPGSVTNMGDVAFSRCAGLSHVYFKGNAPSVGTWIFYGCSFDVTVYYLPDTTGWGSTFSERPAVLWNPVMQTDDGFFGMSTNRFGFNIAGTTNIPIRVEACTNLTEGAWVPLHTTNLVGGQLYFSDPDSETNSARYYRITGP